MDEISFSCTGCGATLRSNGTVAGRKVRCPKCSHVFVAPSPSEPGARASTQIAAKPASQSTASQSAASHSPAPRSDTVRAGERVFAAWGDGFWYPATVLSRDTQSVRVRYDDGATGLVEPQNVCPLSVAVGDRVFCRWQGGPAYFPGRVERLAGEGVHVHYDDGDREVSAVHMLRVVRGEIPWNVGDRVLAQWAPEPFFYPAEISDIADDAIITVAFDDGDRAEVLPVQVRELDLREGDRVFCRWEGGPAYYPARIAEMQGDEIHVHYDDGQAEWSSIGMVRVLPEDLRRDI